MLCVCFFFFLHRPYLFHIGMGDGLGGKIGLVGVMFHSLCVVCVCMVIGDSDRENGGMIAVGDCRVVLRGLCGMHSVCSCGVGVVRV